MMFFAHRLVVVFRAKRDPHPTFTQDVRCELYIFDVEMFDLFMNSASDDNLRRRILVENPAHPLGLVAIALEPPVREVDPGHAGLRADRITMARRRHRT